jgi:hypothetical protein
MGEQWLWHVQQLLLLWSMDDLHWGLCMRVVKGVSDPISKFQSPDLGRSYTYSTKQVLIQAIDGELASSLVVLSVILVKLGCNSAGGGDSMVQCKLSLLYYHQNDFILRKRVN